MLNDEHELSNVKSAPECDVQNNKQGKPHKHSHHTDEHKKKVVNRLSKAIGHLESVKRMVENDRDCSEIVVQLLAVKSALNNTGKYILKEHMAHCIKDAVECGDYETIEEMEKVIDYFL